MKNRKELAVGTDYHSWRTSGESGQTQTSLIKELTTSQPWNYSKMYQQGCSLNDYGLRSKLIGKSATVASRKKKRKEKKKGVGGQWLQTVEEESCNYGWEWQGSCKNVYCTYIWLWNRVLSLYGIRLKQMKTKLSYGSHLLLFSVSLPIQLLLSQYNCVQYLSAYSEVNEWKSICKSCPKSPHFWEKRNLQWN